MSKIESPVVTKFKEMEARIDKLEDDKLFMHKEIIDRGNAYNSVKARCEKLEDEISRLMIECLCATSDRLSNYWDSLNKKIEKELALGDECE